MPFLFPDDDLMQFTDYEFTYRAIKILVFPVQMLKFA